jgi:folate-dependent phosphoribosylglycinamide formyltransferase PurN
MYTSFGPGALGIELSFPDAAALAADAGFEGIQVDAAFLDAHGPDVYRAVLEEYGLRSGSLSLPVDLTGDRDSYEADLDALPGIARRAAAVGCARTSTYIMSFSDDRPFEENFAFHRDRLDPVAETLDEYGIDLVVLARYMRILSPEVVFRYENRIINVHPSLLPSFPGAEAYMQAVEKGVRIAGVTAHYVTTDLDQGPIIAQNAFNVPPEADADELRTKGQPLEAETLLRAVKAHLRDEIAVHRGRTERRNPEDGVNLGAPKALDDSLPREPVDD